MMKILRLLFVFALALALAREHQAFCDDAPKSDVPAVRVTNVTLGGGENEGGAAADASVSLEFKGNEQIHLDPSSVTASVQAGPASHIQVNASVAPFQLYSTMFEPGGVPMRLELSVHSLDLAMDNQVPPAETSQSVFSSIFSIPVNLELSAILGRFRLATSVFGGAATGYVCVAEGCVWVPDVAPTFGGEIVGELALRKRLSLEAAISASYLVSLTPHAFGTDNYDGEAHLYLLKRGDKNEFFFGVEGVEQNRDIKRVNDKNPTEDHNFSLFGVAGVNFDVAPPEAK